MTEPRVMDLWRQAGLPEYFLGNAHLMEFARLCIAEAVAEERTKNVALRQILIEARSLLYDEAECMKSSYTILAEGHPLQGQFDPDEIEAAKDYATLCRVVDAIDAAIRSQQPAPDEAGR